MRLLRSPGRQDVSADNDNTLSTSGVAYVTHFATCRSMSRKGKARQDNGSTAPSVEVQKLQDKVFQVLTDSADDASTHCAPDMPICNNSGGECRRNDIGREEASTCRQVFGSTYM